MKIAIKEYQISINIYYNNNNNDDMFPWQKNSKLPSLEYKSHFSTCVRALALVPTGSGRLMKLTWLLQIIFEDISAERKS